MKFHKSAVLVRLLVALSIGLVGCRQAPPAGPASTPVSAQTHREIPSPAPRDSGQPNLAVGPGGEIYLSWIETLDSGDPALKFAVRKDDKWSPAQTIASGEQL